MFLHLTIIQIPKEIPVVIHNVSIYDNNFIIKERTEEFESQFEWLGENKEKYITCSVLMVKLGNGKTILYKLKFIDSVRFMSLSLSSLVNNLPKGRHNKKYIEYIFVVSIYQLKIVHRL